METCRCSRRSAKLPKTNLRNHSRASAERERETDRRKACIGRGLGQSTHAQATARRDSYVLLCYFTGLTVEETQGVISSNPTHSL